MAKKNASYYKIGASNKSNKNYYKVGASSNNNPILTAIKNNQPKTVTISQPSVGNRSYYSAPTTTNRSSGNGGSSASGSDSSGGFRDSTEATKTWVVPVVNENNSANVSSNTPASSSYSGGSAGVDGPNKIDLTNLFNTYTESANAQKQSITGSYSSQRQALLDSLKRYQDETALAREQQQANVEKAIAQQTESTNRARELQQRAFNSNRADLEAQAYMNARNAMQSAASRGLGGSGLQQLAQLQSQIESGKETSNLANSNQEAQDELTNTLATYMTNANDSLSDYLKQLDVQSKGKDEDITSQVNALSTEESNKLNEIDKNTANLKAQMEYQEAVRFEQALEAAQQFNAQLAAQAAQYAQSRADAKADKEAEYAESYNFGTGTMAQAVNTALRTLNSSSAKGSAKKDAYNTAVENIQSIANNYGISVDDTNTYLNQLDSVYNKQFGTKKKSSFSLGNSLNSLNNYANTYNTVGDYINPVKYAASGLNTAIGTTTSAAQLLKNILDTKVR